MWILCSIIKANEFVTIFLIINFLTSFILFVLVAADFAAPASFPIIA